MRDQGVWRSDTRHWSHAKRDIATHTQQSFMTLPSALAPDHKDRRCAPSFLKALRMEVMAIK